jgi:hypothetical protein
VARPDTRFALAVSAAFLAVGSLSVVFHEPWKDEAQAWLIARQSTGLITLLHNSRYEGSPVLWHLLLLPLTRVGWIPLMSGLNLASATGAVFLFAAFSPFQRAARALFAFGYLPLYEWGTIARNYALGVFLLFAFAAVYPRRRPILQGVILALAANTSAHAALVAGGVLVFLLVERTQQERGAFWSGAFIAAAGIALGAAQSVAPSSVGRGWAELNGLRRLANVGAAFRAGFAPLGHAWFNALPAFQRPGLAALIVMLTRTVTMVFLVTAASYLARRRSVWIIAAFGCAALSGLFYCLWWSGPRHAGFLFIATLLALWLAPLVPGRAPAAGSRLTPVLTGVLALHAVAGLIAVVVEVRTQFSAARATARLIREAGLSGLPMVGEPDLAAMNVLAQAGLRSAYYTNTERWGSFAVWDKGYDEKKRTADARVFERAVQLADRSDVMVVMNRAATDEAIDRVGAALVGARSSDIVKDESFWVYRVPQVAGANRR